MSYQPIPRTDVVVYIRLRQALEAAAELLFHAYAEAMPDRQDWKGPYAWHGSSGEITFDGVLIEYRKEVYSHGDTDCFILTVPLSALYEPDFIAQETAEWAKIKAKKVESEQQRALDELLKNEKWERDILATLKKKYEGL